MLQVPEFGVLQMERRLQGRDISDEGDREAYNVSIWREPLLVMPILTSGQTSLIVRWVVFWIVTIFILALLFAYAHAKRRMQQGLPPKTYHRVRTKRTGVRNRY